MEGEIMKENKTNKIYHYEKNNNKVKRNINSIYDEEFADEFELEDRQLQLQKQQNRQLNNNNRNNKNSSSNNKTAK
jgi:hypothetical protein